MCLDLLLHSSRQVVESLLLETSEALSMQEAGFGLSQEGLPELRETLSRLRAGAQLTCAELLALRKMLQLALGARTRLRQLPSADFPALTVFLPRLHVLTPLERDIDSVFEPGGAIRDDASPLLHKLKRDVLKLTQQTKDELLRIINSATLSKALQEPIYTQRNGRYVLPVQANMPHVIQGIVHDSSASGLTIFVEPLTVVSLSNKTTLKEQEIEREIDRLLSQLTALARESIEELSESFAALVELDFIAARARLAEKYQGVKPELSRSGEMELKGARHPLLVLQEQQRAGFVVPNDIVFGGTIRTLVITGPNTGGKTVYLKMAGLMSLMVRGGLLLPVEPGSRAVIFNQVLADIGDEQSLAQNLSTFSSHMTNMVEILKRCAPGVLVLLDEVGAGTDPLEGATLAAVILQRLNSSGACSIATTHFGQLKSLAYTTAGFINASLDFDEQTLSPTYHLRLGVPGQSKAITIASRLGLASELVDEARQLLCLTGGQLNETIEQLESKLAAASLAEQEAALSREKARAAEEAAAAVLSDLSSQREKLRLDYARQIEHEFNQARKSVRALIAELQRNPDMGKAQKANAELQAIVRDLGWLEPDRPAGSLAQLHVGQAVQVLSLNRQGIVLALPDDDGSGAAAHVAVRSGNMKLTVPVGDVEPLSPAPAQKASASQQGQRQLKLKPKGRGAGTASASAEGLCVFVRGESNTLDLRGQRVDEALSNLGSFIDQCFLAHISPLMIIHGHGTGKVKSAVRNFLKEATYDAEFRPGETYEGGDGVTIVQFN